MKIVINCASCDGNRFTFPDDEDEQVACEECGHQVGTLTQVRERVMEEVLAQRASPQ